MKTILVPTDFSETARNAAHYSIELAKQVKASKIILYNAYQVPISIDPAMPIMQLMNMDELKSVSISGLERLKTELEPLSNRIELEILGEFNVLSVGIDDACKQTNADLIVIGITGTGGGFEEVFIGSNTISVVKHSAIPVLIVPGNVTYKPVKEILLVCDFKKVEETTPVAPLKQILQDTEANLLVLNVAETAIGKDEETTKQKQLLTNLLADYNPEFHFIEGKNFTEAVNDFTDKNMVDLIITIPKKHGFFDSIFRQSHTKKLAFHTHVPLLCMHEEH